MLKQRYTQAASAIHAGEELVERTLDAAAHPRTKPAPVSAAGRRLIIGFVCTLVMLVALLPRLMHPHQDVLTSNGELPEATGELLPLPSDDLTLSVSDIKLVSDTKLSFVLTATGDKVDPHTTLDYNIEPASPYLSGSGLRPIDKYEGQPSNEVRFLLTIKTNDYPILDALGNSLEVTFFRYTSGSTYTEIVHEIDWNTVNFSLLEAGEPIIDLGHNMAVTGFGFTDDGWLTVQSRRPAEALDPTGVIIWLSPDDSSSPLTNIYYRAAKQYQAGDFSYHNNTFAVTRDELLGLTLVTHISFTEEEIHGNWPVTVDLSQLTAE